MRCDYSDGRSMGSTRVGVADVHASLLHRSVYPRYVVGTTWTGILNQDHLQVASFQQVKLVNAYDALTAVGIRYQDTCPLEPGVEHDLRTILARRPVQGPIVHDPKKNPTPPGSITR